MRNSVFLLFISAPIFLFSYSAQAEKCVKAGMQARCGNTTQIVCGQKQVRIGKDKKVKNLTIDFLGIPEAKCKKLGGTPSKNTKDRCNDLISLGSGESQLQSVDMATGWYGSRFRKNEVIQVTDNQAIASAWNAIVAAMKAKKIDAKAIGEGEMMVGSFEIDPASISDTNCTGEAPAAKGQVGTG